MPISATGNSLNSLRTRGAARGFTLVELVVALTVAVLIVGVMATNYDKLQQTMAYREAVRGVLSGMHAARTEALRSGRPVVFAVDLGSRSYGVDGRVTGHFPEDVNVRFIVAEQEVGRNGSGGIRFQPDGGATGGSVDLLRPQGGGVRLRVDWLLGNVSQEAIAG